jgi:hypothetical protein
MHVVHRSDWMTETLTVLMTDDLQTGLATGSKTISHTRFDPVYIRLCTNS